MESQIVLKARRRRIEALAALEAKRAGRSTKDFGFITSRTTVANISTRRPQTQILSFDLPLAA